MRIQNYSYQTNRQQTFTSKESLKKVCEQALEEYNKEFKGIKYPYGLLEEYKNAKCPGKKNLYEHFGMFWDKKLTELRNEFRNYIAGTTKANLQYKELSEKHIELIKKYKVANCGERCDHLQYLLGQRGILSEYNILFFLDKNGTPIKNHVVLTVKESTKDPSPILLDATYGIIERNGTKPYIKKLKKHLNLDMRKLKLKKETLPTRGYNKFLKGTTKSSDIAPSPVSIKRQTP